MTRNVSPRLELARSAMTTVLRLVGKHDRVVAGFPIQITEEVKRE